MNALAKLRRHGSNLDQESLADDAGEAPDSPVEVVRSVVARMTTPLLPDDYLKLCTSCISALGVR